MGLSQLSVNATQKRLTCNRFFSGMLCLLSIPFLVTSCVDIEHSADSGYRNFASNANSSACRQGWPVARLLAEKIGVAPASVPDCVSFDTMRDLALATDADLYLTCNEESEDWVKTVVPGRSFLVVDEDQLWAFMSVVEHSAGDFYQFLSATGSSILFSEEELSRVSPEEIWNLRVDRERNVSYRIGHGLVSLNRISYNFSELSAGVNDTAFFEINNIGTAPVTVVSAKGTCSCTVVDFTTGIVIAPGESYALNVRVAPTRTDTFKSSIRLKLRDSTTHLEEDINLELFGNNESAFRAFDVVPESLRFVVADAEQEQRRKVQIRERRPVGLRIGNVLTGSLPIGVEFIEEIIGNKSRATLIVELNSTLEYLENRDGEIVVDTGVSQQPVVRIPVQVVMRNNK